jgi:hypothetical protein
MPVCPVFTVGFDGKCGTGKQRLQGGRKAGFDRGAEFDVSLSACCEEPFMPNCIVVVQFDLPKRTEELAVKGGTSTAPIYRGLASKGLIRKDYLNGETGTGGVYLWDSRESAQAWFTEARIAELTARFGVRPRLTWYDTHVTVDNLQGETRVNGKAIEEVA